MFGDKRGLAITTPSATFCLLQNARSDKQGNLKNAFMAFFAYGSRLFMSQYKKPQMGLYILVPRKERTPNFYRGKKPGM